MKTVECVAEGRVEERIDRGRVVPLWRQTLRYPGDDARPPIAVKRTTRLDGPVAPAVIMVHGFAQNRYTWRVSERSVSGFLADLGYDVRVVELRGHGLSRAWGAGNALTFEEYVSDVLRLVDDCPAPPFVVGHSLGGAVALGVAASRPLAGIVPIGGIGLSFARANRSLRALCRLSLELAPLLERVRFGTGWAGVLIGELYSITDLGGYAFPLSGWTPGSVERELLAERLAKGFDWTSIEVWLQMARWAHGERFAYADQLANSDVSAMVIAGDHDRLGTPDDARAIYDALPQRDRELVVLDAFETGSHWGHLDLILGHRAPGVVWSRLAAWLAQRCR